MKKLFLLAFVLLSLTIVAQNPHVVGGSMLYVGDALIPVEDWYWQAWELEDPGDIIDSNSPSSVYYYDAPAGGYTMNLQDMVDWFVGHTLHIEYYMCPMSGNTAPEGMHFEQVDYVLTGAGFDPIPPYPSPQYFDEILCITAVELTAFQAVMQEEFAAISWTTATESDMNCFNIYRDELLIHTEDATNSSQTTVYEFIDTEVVDGEEYVYDLEAVNLDGTAFTIGSTTLTIVIPPIDEFSNVTALYNNYPNPFKGSTAIKYAVKEGMTASLTIYNAKGQVVDTYTLGQTGVNGAEQVWNAETSGIYFYKLESEGVSQVKKMLVLK